MSEVNKTAEDIAKDYTAMGHSVTLINGIIDGSKMANDSVEDRQDCVDRNVEHLELKKAEKTVEDATASIWTDENFTAIDAAIAAGNNYTA